MPIQHAVLALLARQPSYGYELRTSFQEAVGPQWGELNIGHLYQVLERLIRDGLASKREVSQRARPDKFVFRLTKDGRAELERWLKTPFVRQSGYRDDFFLKLFAAARLGEEWLDRVIKIQRDAYLGELAALTQLRARHAEQPLVALLIEAAVLHTEANLRIVELAERSGTQIVEASERPSVRTDSASTRGRAGEA